MGYGWDFPELIHPVRSGTGRMGPVKLMLASLGTMASGFTIRKITYPLVTVAYLVGARRVVIAIQIPDIVEQAAL